MDNLLKIQSSPKCKAWGKSCRAAYGLYVSKKIFLATQQLGYNEVAVRLTSGYAVTKIWIFEKYHV
jgi:hypothetical protein